MSFGESVYSLNGESSMTKLLFVNKNQSVKISVEKNIAVTEGACSVGYMGLESPFQQLTSFTLFLHVFSPATGDYTR